jgi:hypothetical protein
LQTVCQDWPQTVIFLISSSQVARITGVSHWHPACFITFEIGFRVYAQASLIRDPPIHTSVAVTAQLVGEKGSC